MTDEIQNNFFVVLYKVEKEPSLHTQPSLHIDPLVNMMSVRCISVYVHTTFPISKRHLILLLILSLEEKLVIEQGTV